MHFSLQLAHDEKVKLNEISIQEPYCNQFKTITTYRCGPLMAHFFVSQHNGCETLTYNKTSII